MGSILLFLLLLSLFLLSYRSFGGFLSPSVELTGMFLLSTFFYFVWSGTWETDLSINTILVVFIGMVCFICGEATGNQIRVIFLNKINKSEGNSLNTTLLQTRRYYINFKSFVILTLISLITLYLYYDYSMKISIIAGNRFGLEGLLTYVYYAKYHLTDIIALPKYITFGLVISRCFSSYCVFLICLASIRNELFKKKNLIYLIPIVVYFFQAMLAGGRTQFFRLIVQYLIILLVLQRCYKKEINISFKFIIRVICAIFVFFFLYHEYGVLRGSLYTDFDTILSYPGTSLQALNLYLESPYDSSELGEATLVTIRLVLNKLGFDTQVFSLSLPKIYWQNGETNIYTAFYRYISDYGFMMTGIILFGLGVFYGYLKKWMLLNNTVSSLIVYSMLIYPVVEFIFEERFFIGVLSAGTVYYLIGVFAMKNLIVTEEY